MSSRNKKKIKLPQDLAETSMDGQVFVYSELIPGQHGIIVILTIMKSIYIKKKY